MRLPRWIPQTPRSLAYEPTWEAMSPNERRWSFVADMVFVAVFLLILSLASCEPAYAQEVCYENAGERVRPTHEVRNLLITVNWFDTEEGLQWAVSQRSGEEEASTEAYSECEVHPEKDIGWCEIWVVRPRNVLGDPNMDTLGHEVLHGLMGDFHE